MSRTGWIGAIVVLVIIILGALWFMNSKSATNATPTTSGVAAQTGADQAAPSPDTAPQETGSTLSGTVTAGTGAPMSVTVTYNGSSFSPATVTIAKGGTVTFTSSVPMWIASAPHPAHTGYDGTSRATHCAPNYSGAKPFDQCASGTSFSFTFDKTGTFAFHDHMNADAHGTVVVQ